jgi:hypothetical protein
MKKKIAVLYDTSYLTGNFQSLKKFILSRRFCSQPKPGKLGFLAAVLPGKGKAKAGADQKVTHNPTDLFVITETIPNEVIKEIDKLPADREKGQQAIKVLLADGALKVDLAQDTVVGELSGNYGGAPFHLQEEEDTTTDERIVGYVGRLVSFMTNEQYDLAIVATEDEGVLSRLAEKSQQGKAVLGLTGEQVTKTRKFCDILTELANRGAASPISLED